MGKEIFIKNFSGSIDALIDHCQTNADFVDDVISGKTDFELTNEEALTLIRDEFPGISDDDSYIILNEIKLIQAKETLDRMVQNGLCEIIGYEEGEPVYGPTELGKQMIEKLKKRKNQ